MKFFQLFFLLIFLSCSFSETYTFEEISEIAKKSGNEIALPKDRVTIVNCADYGRGCISGRKVIVRNLDMFFVEFKTEKQAHDTAVKIDQYYIRNWVLDDVADEPLLEEFARDVFHAKRPAKDQAGEESHK